MKQGIKNKNILFLGLAVLLVMHVIGFSIMPLPDPSEARYAVIAKHMAESGNYIMPMIWIKGELIPFMSKPPFAFWIMTGAINFFGANELAVRFPTFIAGLLMLILMFYVLKRYKGVYYAIISTLITATSGGFYLMSGMSLVDMWLCLFSTGAIFLYYGFIFESKKSLKKLYSLLIFLFLGLGFLTKGPVCLIYFGVPIFIWTLIHKRWNSLRDHAWFFGSALFLIITLPWFIMAEQNTPGYLRQFFLYENLMRFLSPDKSHDLYSSVSHYLPPGTAMVYLLLVFMPWTLIVPLYYAWKKKSIKIFQQILKEYYIAFRKKMRQKENVNFAFFSTATVSITLFWCLSSHIMAYYLVPIIPLLAVWCTTIMRKIHFPVKYTIKISLVLFVTYAIAYIPGFFIVNAFSSTKEIITTAQQIRNDRQLHGKIIFVRRIKYSSYFYGQGLVLPHPKEKVTESFSHISLGRKNENIYIFLMKYLKRIPNPENIKILYKNHKWGIAIRKSIKK